MHRTERYRGRSLEGYRAAKDSFQAGQRFTQLATVCGRDARLDVSSHPSFGRCEPRSNFADAIGNGILLLLPIFLFRSLPALLPAYLGSASR